MKQNQNTLTQRSSYWDNMKGVLIALVVFGHCLYSSLDIGIIRHVVDAIYFFHMPAFVFVSGYFSKSKNSRSARSLTKLLSAYLLLTTVHLGMAFINGHPLSVTTPYNSAWYLLALVAWRLITPYFSKTKWSLPLFLVISLFAGFWQDIDNTFALARIISLYPFFLAGYFLSKENSDKLVSFSPLKRLLPGVVIICAGAGIAFLSKSLLHVGQKDFGFAAYEEIFRQLPGRAVVFVVAFLCIAGLLLLTPKGNIPLLTKVGRNSLAIFLIHRPITLLMNRFIGGFSAVMLLAYAAVFTVAACVVLGSDIVSRLLDKALNFFTDVFLQIRKPRKAALAKTDRRTFDCCFAFSSVYRFHHQVMK